MTKYSSLLLLRLCVLIIICVCAADGYAQGSLVINPKRVILDETKRTSALTLFNNSEDTASYAISFKHFEMLENGEFKDIDSIKTDGLFSDKIVRFFPREITLAPHMSQTVRVQYLKPADLLAGEYRSHLYFRSIERSKALGTPLTDSQKTLSVDLKIIYGVAIPIIVRNKTAPAVVTVDGLRVSRPDSLGMITISANINRSGNESVYGTLILTHISPSGSETELSVLKGIGVYVPLPIRKCTYKIKNPTNIDIHKGSLKLIYQSLSNESKEVTLASTESPTN